MNQFTTGISLQQDKLLAQSQLEEKHVKKYQQFETMIT